MLFLLLHCSSRCILDFKQRCRCFIEITKIVQILLNFTACTIFTIFLEASLMNHDVFFTYVLEDLMKNEFWFYKFLTN